MAIAWLAARVSVVLLRTHQRFNSECKSVGIEICFVLFMAIIV